MVSAVPTLDQTVRASGATLESPPRDERLQDILNAIAWIPLLDSLLGTPPIWFGIGNYGALCKDGCSWGAMTCPPTPDARSDGQAHPRATARVRARRSCLRSRVTAYGTAQTPPGRFAQAGRRSHHVGGPSGTSTGTA